MRPTSPARPRNGSVRTRFGAPSVPWSLGRRREAGSIPRGLSYNSRESVGRESRVRPLAPAQRTAPLADRSPALHAWGRLGVSGLLDRVTVKKRSRGYSPAEAILGLCETLIAGGECLDDIALLRGDSA